LKITNENYDSGYIPKSELGTPEGCIIAGASKLSNDCNC
jgi:hypothetical protein